MRMATHLPRVPIRTTDREVRVGESTASAATEARIWRTLGNADEEEYDDDDIVVTDDDFCIGSLTEFIHEQK